MRSRTDASIRDSGGGSSIIATAEINAPVGNRKNLGPLPSPLVTLSTTCELVDDVLICIVCNEIFFSFNDAFGIRQFVDLLWSNNNDLRQIALISRILPIGYQWSRELEGIQVCRVVM